MSNLKDTPYLFSVIMLFINIVMIAFFIFNSFFVRLGIELVLDKLDSMKNRWSVSSFQAIDNQSHP